jgi:hypothetical protein
MRRGHDSRKETARALVNRRLRETRACRCGGTKPAIVTETHEGKVKGWCEDCIDSRRGDS